MPRRRSRWSEEDIPYDPENPPVISDLSPIFHQCLTAQGFDERLIEETKYFVCLFCMSGAEYRYKHKDVKRHVSKRRSFSATFGPTNAFSTFGATGRGGIQIKTDTPLAKELLDVQDNGAKIFLRGQKGEKLEKDEPNDSHLFKLQSYYKSLTSSQTNSTRRLKCFVVNPYVVFVEERDYWYGETDYSEESYRVDFHACSLTEDLISMLNDGLANLMKQISEKSTDLPRRGLLKLLTDHIQDERWNLQCIFGLEQSYEDRYESES